MKDFTQFKRFLNEKNIKVDDETLKAVELYHEWLKKDGLIDGKELYDAVIEYGREYFLKTGNEPFLM